MSEKGKSEEIAGNEIILTENNWDEEVLKSDMPILVDFYADWCAPCRMMAPIVSELAQYYSGKLKIGRLNTKEIPSIATTYRINCIPTFILFKNGRAICRTRGLNSKEYFIQKCNKILKFKNILCSL